MERWADHVERLVMPEGVKALRRFKTMIHPTVWNFGTTAIRTSRN